MAAVFVLFFLFPKTVCSNFTNSKCSTAISTAPSVSKKRIASQVFVHKFRFSISILFSKRAVPSFPSFVVLEANILSVITNHHQR